MKITIEPTMDQSKRKPNMKHPIVSICVPDDDLTLPNVLEMLVEPALRAFGYGLASKTMKNAMGQIHASIEHVEKLDL